MKFKPALILASLLAFTFASCGSHTDVVNLRPAPTYHPKPKPKPKPVTPGPSTFRVVNSYDNQ